jgi:predicted HTH transcriptional regulator
MSREESLIEIVNKTFSLPPKVIAGYSQLEPAFTSGDLARICDISRSSAKFYLAKMVELRMVTKVPHKRRYQKYANANTFSDWLKDLIKLAVTPLETGALNLPEEE